MPRGGSLHVAKLITDEGLAIKDLASYTKQSSAYVSLQLSGQRNLTVKLKDAIITLLPERSNVILKAIPEYSR